MDNTLTRQQLEERLARREHELALVKFSLTRFSYAISHEINSPINTLNNLLDMFDEDYRETLDEDGAELLGMVKLSARRTRELAAAMLDYSRCYASMVDPQMIDSRTIIDDVLVELAPVIDDSGTSIDIGDMPQLSVPGKALHHLFRHLIDNAIKFTDSTRTAPVISINAHRTHEGVEFVVEDQGIGIEPEERERIFSVFERLKARSEFEGSGLGLAVCMQIVLALQGRLWVDEGSSGGSAFHVLIPQPPTEAE